MALYLGFSQVLELTFVQVEKVKRRREEREKELAWMEEEKARMLR